MTTKNNTYTDVNLESYVKSKASSTIVKFYQRYYFFLLPVTSFVVSWLESVEEAMDYVILLQTP